MSWELDIRFKRGCLSPAAPELAQMLMRREPSKPARAIPVVDSGLLLARPRLLQELGAYARAHNISLCEEALLPGGARARLGEDYAASLRERFHQASLDRHCHVLALGGGSLQDAAAFAAATYRRGLRLTRLPSTVLSQCATASAMRCGLDALGGKDILGCFAPPFGLLIDTELPETQDERSRRFGVAEALRAALVHDARFFEWLKDQPSPLERADELTRRAALLGLEHVLHGGDPFEHGQGRRLDFGGWAAPRLEQAGLTHGEALAVGMALDTVLSTLLSGLHLAEAQQILQLLEHLGLPLWHEALERLDETALEEYRRQQGGTLAVTLLRRPGGAMLASEVPYNALREAVKQLGQRQLAAEGSGSALGQPAHQQDSSFEPQWKRVPQAEQRSFKA